MHRDSPTLEEGVEFVKTPGVGQRRMQDRGLLVPITDAAANPLLLRTSVLDASIDLGARGTRPSLANAPMPRECGLGAAGSGNRKALLTSRVRSLVRRRLPVPIIRSKFSGKRAPEERPNE